jgi:hypothetical protein
MTGHTCTFAGVVAIALASFASLAAASRDNAVLLWNTAMLEAITNTGSNPVFAARGFAILHTCMYDAWAAYDPVAVGTQLGGSLRQPESEHTPANKQEAISFAAYTALVDLFPGGQKALLFDPLMNDLGYAVTGDSAPATTGKEACAAVLAFRHGDGANQLGDEPGTPVAGTPYADYTAYMPVNTVSVLNYPDRWQPLPTSTPPFTQTFLAPHWGLVAPFALTSAEQFRPGPPALLGDNEFEHQAEEIVKLSAKLDDRTKAIAVYWADGPNTVTPPGHWNLFAQFVSRRDGHTLDEDVKMFFALGNALLDASIAVWETKRFYDSVRPVTAVRYLYAGRTIDAWGGPGAGTQPIAGEAFRSYIMTPPFAEYTSGHSAFSAASASILELFTGNPAFGASATVLAGSSPVEPGVAPSSDITLSWATFDNAANQAGVSRRYGGIHFHDGDLASRKMGRQIGSLVWAKAETYFDGTAVAPLVSRAEMP